MGASEREIPHCAEMVMEKLTLLQGTLAGYKDAHMAGVSLQIKAIDRLTDKISDYIDLQSKSIPLKLVFLLFLLVFGLVFGIEVLQKMLKVSLFG